MLSEMQKDVLTELVNVYVGKAASLLSEMVDQKINLTIPQVELIYVYNEDSLSQYSAVFSSGHIISSGIGFGQSFRGKAFLIFPVEEAKIIVNACLGEELVADKDQACELVDTDFDILREVSNVVLNAIVGEFGNLLETKLEYSLPEIELIFLSEFDYKGIAENNVYVLILHTSFMLAEAKVKGVVLIVLSMNSVTWLINKLDELLGNDYE